MMKPASDCFAPGLIYCRYERPFVPTGACDPALFFTLRGIIVYNEVIAPLAQWLEQRPFKSWVVGSSPTGGTGWPCETIMFRTVFCFFFFTSHSLFSNPSTLLHWPVF